MASKPVDVMVVNFNTAGLLQPMFDALRRADSERLASYLVVDNASRDDSVQRMAQVCPEALLLSNKQNVGFGRANNQLLAHLKGKYALLLNTDAFVAADSLQKRSTTWTPTRSAAYWGCAWRVAMATCSPVVATSPHRSMCSSGVPGWGGSSQG